MGKLNTLYIEGPANCGKCLFADIIQDYLLNPGIMTNWNKYQNFPLQMCQHVSIVQWNEPNFAPDKENDLKKLLGGDRLTFDIKNQPHGVIVNTPILITGNSYIFPRNDIWSSRIRHWKWKQAQFLINITCKRLHPMTFEDLILWAESKLEPRQSQDKTQNRRSSKINKFNDRFGLRTLIYTRISSKIITLSG